MADWLGLLGTLSTEIYPAAETPETPRNSFSGGNGGFGQGISTETAPAPRLSTTRAQQYLEMPGDADPIGKCAGCRFTAPLSPRRLCGRCEVERLFAAAERALAGVMATSDEGELLRAGDEP